MQRRVAPKKEQKFLKKLEIWKLFETNIHTEGRHSSVDKSYEKSFRKYSVTHVKRRVGRRGGTINKH